MAEQQRNMDYLNSTGDKFVKSLPRQKSEQLRSKLADLNDKWRDINLHAEKRQNQVSKNIPARYAMDVVKPPSVSKMERRSCMFFLLSFVQFRFSCDTV